MAKVSRIIMAATDEAIMNRIYMIRGQKVMLDEDLADLYQVPTKRLNEQVKRNIDRFPADFMFQLTEEEFENLKSQFATSSWGGRRKLPSAFTEHGYFAKNGTAGKTGGPEQRRHPDDLYHPKTVPDPSRTGQSPAYRLPTKRRTKLACLDD